MAKGSGNTRAGSSSNPRALEASSRPSASNSRDLDLLNSVAERLYADGSLTVDPGDAVYEQARNLRASTIEDSIEGSTDWFAQATPNYVQVGNSGLDAGEAMREWGADDMVQIPYENRSLMDIIMELRMSNMADIYRKYK